jgi:hypothetical protein
MGKIMIINKRPEELWKLRNCVGDYGQGIYFWKAEH